MHVTIRLTSEVAPVIQQVATEKGQDVASFLEEFVHEPIVDPVAFLRAMQTGPHLVCQYSGPGESRQNSMGRGAPDRRNGQSSLRAPAA